MKSLGNIVWLLFGGIIVAVIYFLVGFLLCLTVIGIPFGVQLFKLGRYALWPFGHEIVRGENELGCANTLMNVLWFFLGCWEVALIHLVCGLVFCITIVGIPFGRQHFKMALMSVFPFGKEIQ